MKIKKTVIKRKVAGDTILIPVGSAVLDSNGLFVLNEVAEFIWDILPEAETEAEICSRVLEEFEASPEQVKVDVSEFLSALQKLGLL